MNGCRGEVAKALTYYSSQCGLSDPKCCMLSGLRRYREASLVAAQGLKLDPFNSELKKAAEEASRGMLKDLLSGDTLPSVSICHDTVPAPHCSAPHCSTRLFFSMRIVHV